MRAKKNIRTVAIVLLMASALPAFSSNSVPGSSTTEPVKTEDARGRQLLSRLEEIKNMDRSEMTRLEKKSLRKEVREIKKDMKAIKGGVYLSVGAIIIIILLLILIL